MKAKLLAGSAAVAIAMIASTETAGTAAAPTTEASARLVNRDGTAAGVALFQQTPRGVRIDINVSRLTPGPHGVHIHSVGKCEHVQGFRSAGPHFDVGGHKHGRIAPGGPHTGDMENQNAGKYGFLRATITTTAFTLGPGPRSLFDADGSSIVVHAGPDDYTTNPDGKAGDRIACGVIKAM